MDPSSFHQIYRNYMITHRRRNRGGWGGASPPPPPVKNVGGGGGNTLPPPPPAFMAENPLFCELLMIYFNYDFFLSLSRGLIVPTKIFTDKTLRRIACFQRQIRKNRLAPLAHNHIFSVRYYCKKKKKKRPCY